MNETAREQRLQIAAVELFVDVLGRADEDGQDRFYSRLAEAVCELGSMRYDEVLRRVRAAGGHGVDLGRFEEIDVTSQSSPLTRRALEEDRVLEVRSDFERELPQAIGLLSGAPVVCTPMAAAGREVGVILSDRGAEAPPLSDDERNLLWSLGKMAALAAVARIATAQRERAQNLQTRLDLAREVHERVIQRLFGVSMVLGVDGPIGDDDRERASSEVEAALGELRDALTRSLEPTAEPSRTTLRDELDRLGRQYKDVPLRVDWEPLAEIPPDLEPLAVSVLAEALRNAEKHASPTEVTVSITQGDGAVALEVRNDGLPGPGSGEPEPAGGGGLGLRLASYESLQRGAMLEFGREADREWRVRLVLPGDHGGGGEPA